ncbi:MAG: endonuclease/exonuclease/phosphatase family metal-dependent hydrolase [Saprospiraceae bacterium]|jgi:endonuclease/exonuclease/phosphatase family metal-dependent hydrolase
MKILKTTLKIIGSLIGLFLLYVIITILHGTATDFQPEEKVTVDITGPTAQKVIEDSLISLVTWNVGFGGLGAKDLFFYDDNGTFSTSHPVIPPKENSVRNHKGMNDFIKNTKVDFYLIQEVDKNSKRSYHNNQYEDLQAQTPNYSGSFAMNYNVKRVPLPIAHFWGTLGKVESGLASYSKYQPTEATRYQFPGNYSWPMRIFQLDRCFLVNRFDTKNGKELVVINTHNSAYDKGGKLKTGQMEYLKNYLITEYEKGNYVVVGGDWNQCPPYFPFDKLMPGKGGAYETINVEADYLPKDWVWAYDPLMPTNRKSSEIYSAGETFTTLIDFFLISPNLSVKKIKTINQRFEFSDHQPVYIELNLN